MCQALNKYKDSRDVKDMVDTLTFQVKDFLQGMTTKIT